MGASLANKNPFTKAFSFFSHVHHTFSSIDFFLLDNKLLHCISSCEYHTIAVSDHTPSSVDIGFPVDKILVRSRKFPLLRLTGDTFKSFVSEQIQAYLELNDTTDVGSGTLWEALKAFVCGQVISYIS